MAFRKPNIKGPRFRVKHKTILNTLLFKKFKEKYPNYSNLDLKTFTKIIKEDNKKIPELVKNNRDGIELRESLGNIILVSCETGTRRIPIDYKESIRLDTIIVHKNWDSDNRLAKLMYTNCSKKISFENRNLWGFVCGREFKRSASKIFKLDHTKYMSIDNKSKLSKMMR